MQSPDISKFNTNFSISPKKIFPESAANFIYHLRNNEPIYPKKKKKHKLYFKPKPQILFVRNNCKFFSNTHHNHQLRKQKQTDVYEH